MQNMRKIALMLALVMAFALVGGAASYTVQSGDVLWRIAQDFGTDYKSLAEANGIDNPNLIYPGQVITWGEEAPVEPTPEPTPETGTATYTGTALGYGGEMTVSVTMDGDKITGVSVTSHSETTGIGTNAIDALPSKIAETNSVMVDTVAGATKSSEAILEAVKAALVAGGFDLANYEIEVGSTEKTLENATYDVVIVGGGGAGLTAAIEAKSLGASVVIVEKMPFVGGNTILAHGEFAVANSWIQEEQGIEDSPELFANDLYAAGDELGDYEVVLKMAEESGPTTLWLRDFVGVEFTEGYLGQEGGHSVARQVLPIGHGVELVATLLEKAEELGVEIMTEVKGESLVQDASGRVTGINVSSGDATAVISATNGLILATGGFGANVEMREQYNTIWASLGAEMPTSNAAGITGDGMIMAQDIGAQLQNMEQIQLYPFNNPITGVFTAIEAPNWTNEGHMYINQAGERFVNEFSTRKYRAAEILAQEGEYVYVVYNQAVADRLGLEEDYADVYATSLEQGVFFKADTIEEIATHYDIDPVTLQATLDKYNAGIAAGDDEFGREYGMVEMHEGPWFILKGKSTVHHTMGGIKIDPDARVLDTEGNVIDGLYAAGEVTGSTHGSERVGSCAITDVLIYGRIAGNSAAKANDTVYTADVIIAGAGGAGMSAAIQAADSGASVVILEKMSYAGGNTVRSEGGTNAAGTTMQADQGITDSPEMMYADAMAGGKDMSDPDLLTFFTESSASTVEWLTELGADLTSIGQGAGQSAARLHRPFDGSKIGAHLVPVLMANLEERGIEILYSTEVTKLIETDGKVTGLEAVDADGNTLTFSGNAVVMATGGFGANPDIYTEYRPDLVGFSTTNHIGATGDGIAIAQEIGADVIHMDQIQTNPTVEPSSNIVISESVRGFSAIFVNSDGERFTNEMGTRDVLSAEILGLPEKYTYLVFDQQAMDAMAALRENYDKGIIMEGETLAELATVIGVDGTALEATVETWNGYVAGANDADFGRTTGMNIELTEAPFYAIKVAPAVHYTMGGIVINTNTEVIDTNGDVIPGLFAAGEVTGGLHGGNRLGGNAVADITTFGYQAGTKSSEYALAMGKVDLVLPEVKEAAPSVQGNFTDGVYTAASKGLFGDITVEVTVENKSIVSIVATDHKETAAIFASVERVLIPEIIATQSVEVDAVAGATISSNAVIAAVEMAIAG